MFYQKIFKKENIKKLDFNDLEKLKNINIQIGIFIILYSILSIVFNLYVFQSHSATSYAKLSFLYILLTLSVLTFQLKLKKFDKLYYIFYIITILASSMLIPEIIITFNDFYTESFSFLSVCCILYILSLIIIFLIYLNNEKGIYIAQILEILLLVMGVISVFYTSLHEEMITIIYVLFFFIFGSILSINNSLDLGLFKYFNKKYVDSLRTLFIDILFITSIAVVLMHMVKTYSFSINNAILLFCGFVIAIILISIILIMYDNRKINETKIDTLEEEQIVTSNYYEIILSKLGDNIAYIDKNDKVIYHNNSMYNLIGINRKGEYLHSENDFKLPIYDEYQKAKETLQDVELNFWHVVPKDGKNIYLNGTCSPVILDNKFDGCVISLYDLTTQKEDESSMKKLIDQKNSLLSEIHHRVKNNLQIINSLLSLQSHNTKDEVIKEALTDAQVRVKSMALVHEFFYQSTDFKYLDFKAYLSKLLSEIQYAYDTGEIEFKLNVKNCDDDSDIIGIDMETAIPIGLIINEAVTNSIKYAFLNKKGEISVKFSKQEFEYNLLISDNGVGLNKDYISGFGINLINSLVIQLEGNINIENKNGCTIDITYNN